MRPEIGSLRQRNRPSHGCRNRRQITQILGMRLVSTRLQMKYCGATEELLTLTKQTRIDQRERVRVN
jgi:hypothetical protein